MPAAAQQFAATPHPIVKVARRLVDFLEADEPIDARLLRALFCDATGQSQASSGWSMRHAYDALELAQILYLRDQATSASDQQKTLARIEALAMRLPVQSTRSEQQIALQQFSTPAPLAWLMTQAAALRPGSTLLEPSAGTGMLVWASPPGCKLLLNEIDADRRACLAEAFPQAAITGHDAELLDDLLPHSLIADAILMNPPFARSDGRGEDRHAAERHVHAVARRLRPGGRLVALLPPRFDTSRLPAGLTIRLDAMLPRGNYTRHGTDIAVRLIVCDHVTGSANATLREVPDLAALLHHVRGLSEAEPCLSTPTPVRPVAPRRSSLFGRLDGTPPTRPSPNLGNKNAHAPVPVSVLPLDDPAPAGEPAGIYLPWRASRMQLPDAADHPTPLIESLAMGSISAPKPTHVPVLPTHIVANGIISAAQIETLVYAGAAFERDLPGRFVPSNEGTAIEPSEQGHAYAQGYYLGDGTGAGKGRQVAGIILDQWLRGRRRHIWFSKNEALLEDARRDWAAVGGVALDVQPLSGWKLGTAVTLDAGILFVTYPTLRSGREEATRLRQILDWAGDAFDGVIAFDEAHALANAAGGEGKRGPVKGSEQGIAGLRLQNLLPRARILYVSATGASDIANLSYATRLGLWGPGTAFADRNAFVSGVRQGGIAAMELVARDLKALGLYTARALSFAGVEYDLLEHQLTPEQIATYNAYAEAWAIIHRNLAAALEATRVIDSVTGSTLNAAAKSAALSRFESVKQRFFAQLLLSAKLPSLIPAIEQDLARGDAVVVQLVSTAEAMLGRRLAELTPDERERLEIDLSPREYIIDYLLGAFPTRQMRVFTDADGNIRSEPLNDEQGNAVHCRAAEAARDNLVEQLCALPPIATALDAIIERFGVDAVAEVTGRTRRLLAGSNGVQQIERRGQRANLTEAQAFMDGTKMLLVFSDAGGTGRSYHACVNAKNQARRIHYLLEPGWRADAAIQGLGRTHRSAQASAPLFRPVTTDVRGERRFISTIARRLDTLGALTRGQRQTGGQNLFNPADNLESDYAKEALLAWYRLLFAGKLRSITFGDFQDRSGLNLEGEGGGLREDLPPIQRWLNRLLAFPIALQNAIFDEFLGLVEARVDAAREAGTLDLGVETRPVEKIRVISDTLLRTDPASGAETHLLELALTRRPRPLMLAGALRQTADGRSRLLVNARSGRACVQRDGRSLLTEDGELQRRYELVRPLQREHATVEGFTETSWAEASREAFDVAWQKEVDEVLATTTTETLYLATGLLLPIWNILPGDHVQILRVVDQTGRSLLGREVPTLALPELGRRLGLDLDRALDPALIAQAVLDTGQPCPLPGPAGLTLKRALVGGEQRLELAGFAPGRLSEYKALGCFSEIIRYQTRLFIPLARANAILGQMVT